MLAPRKYCRNVLLPQVLPPYIINGNRVLHDTHKTDKTKLHVNINKRNIECLPNLMSTSIKWPVHIVYIRSATIQKYIIINLAW